MITLRCNSYIFSINSFGIKQLYRMWYGLQLRMYRNKLRSIYFVNVDEAQHRYILFIIILPLWSFVTGDINPWRTFCNEDDQFDQLYLLSTAKGRLERKLCSSWHADVIQHHKTMSTMVQANPLANNFCPSDPLRNKLSGIGIKILKSTHLRKIFKYVIW